MLRLTPRSIAVRALLLAALGSLLAASIALPQDRLPPWIWILVSYAAAAFALAPANALRRKRIGREKDRDRFFALSNDLLCIAGLDGYLRRVNPAFLKHSGYSREELASIPFLSLVHPEHVAGAAAQLANLAEGREVEGFECLCRMKNGSYHWFSWSAVAVAEEGLALAIGRDTTARKELEERLARFSALVESSHDAILSLGRDGRITSWNAGAERLFGYASNEIVGQHVSLLAPPDERADQTELLQCIQREQTMLQAGVIRRRKDGSLVPIDLTLSPIRDANDEILGLSAIARDVTERQRAEEALRESNAALTASIKEAEAANLAKNEFLANVSHEIRTPMTTILGYAELLSSNPKLSDDRSKRQEALNAIKRNGQHLLEILDDILDLSKVEAGKLAIERLPCSPRQVLQEVAELMHVRADEKGLNFETWCEESVPALMETDPTRLRQILINTVGNAIKFTETGGVRLAVRRGTTSADASQVLFEISDTGIGMTEEQLGKLFIPFSQADASTTRKYGGAGLGLSICTRLVALLGGEIDVQSRQGEGSVVRVALPIGTPPDARLFGQVEERGKTRSRFGRTTSPEPEQFAARVLLAEDSPDNQRLIELVLKNSAIEVEIVEDGQAAVDRGLGSGAPLDVILMDMQMPVLDGYSATRRLRHHGCTTPIIALTAHAMKGDREKCLEAGCDAYMTKPLDVGALIKQILDYARQRQTHAAQPATND